MSLDKFFCYFGKERCRYVKKKKGLEHEPKKKMKKKPHQEIWKLLFSEVGMQMVLRFELQ